MLGEHGGAVGGVQVGCDEVVFWFEVVQVWDAVGDLVEVVDVEFDVDFVCDC